MEFEATRTFKSNTPIEEINEVINNYSKDELIVKKIVNQSGFIIIYFGYED